jgi:hypothetical protein
MTHFILCIIRSANSRTTESEVGEARHRKPRIVITMNQIPSLVLRSRPEHSVRERYFTHIPERAAQLERAAGNMGDKTDREHRLHPVTVGEWQRWAFVR